MSGVAIIFSSLNFAKSVASYTKIIESLDAKVEKLSKAEFNAGVNSLEQAMYASDERTTLLREARAFFNKAVGLEKDDRLILSYLGLSLCHYHLGEYENSKRSLQNALKVEATGETLSKVGSAAEIIFLGGIAHKISKVLALLNDNPTNTFSQAWYEKKRRKIEELKDEIRGYLSGI